MTAVTFSQITLLLCALFLAGRSYRTSEQSKISSLMVFSLAAAFIACAAAANLLLPGNDQDTVTLKRLLDNLAFFASIPLIASAALDIAFRFNWSKAAWGRWLLVLFALFELCRRSEMGLEYSQFMAALSSAVLLFSMLKMHSLMTRLIGGISSVLWAMSLLIYSQASLFPDYASPVHHLLLLAISLAMIALTTGKLCPAIPEE